MIRALLLLLLVVPVIGAQEKAPVPVLEGTYDLQEFLENNKAGDDRKDATVVFKDGVMTVKLKTREDAAKFTVDTAKPPFQIDFKPTVGEAKATLGIWRIEKGEITIVFQKNGPRPSDFKGLGEGVVKFVLVKSIPKKDK